VWSETHPYLLIYLLGCMLVLILSMLKVAMFWLIGWITKTNVAAKNLKKIAPVDEQTAGSKAATFIGVLAFEAALSWINVVVAIWQIAVTLLKVVREALVSTPEAIKLLRFPLRNNPNMSPETVWAYLQALNIKAGGEPPGQDELRDSLDGVCEAHPSFNRTSALNQLGGLNVMSGDVISSALHHRSSKEEEDEDEDKETWP